jgi:hypothetical protein
VGVDAEAGSPDDMLAVYFVDASGKLSGPIWSHSLKGGLDAPALPLFERIKHRWKRHIRNKGDKWKRYQDLICRARLPWLLAPRAG